MTRFTNTIANISLGLAASALLGLALTISGCGKSGGPGNSNLSTKNQVTWYIPSDVESLNPILSGDESSNYIEGEMYERLTGGNPRTQAFLPLLAKLPVESADHLTFTFEMDSAAHWSDGKPVTAKDAIFSYKIVCNPLVINAAPVRSYFGDLDSVWIPAGHPNQVVFHFRKYRYDLLKVINYVSIMPQHIWDPNNLSDGISWADLRNPNASNSKIKDVATLFQDPKSQRDPKFMIGSGPYVFENWATNDHVTLKKDPNYWAKDRPWLDAYPDEIIFKTIMDQNAALISLKRKDIDIDQSLSAPQYLNEIDPKQFPYISKDTVYENVYTYIGWNNLSPLFSDKNVRKALTALIDRDEIIRSLSKGLAKKVDGPVAPTQPNYDPTVHEPAFDPAAASKMLNAAGWVDHDGDGILDKTINGRKVNFHFTLSASSASGQTGKQVMLVIANDLKRAGIQVDVSQIETTVYLNNLRNHNFDAYLGGWVGNVTGSEGVEDEISQLWESSQAKNKGSNYVSYSDPQADAIMEQIKVEPDRSKRIALSHQLQHIMVDDQPVTFMYSTPDRMAWIDRFDNMEFFPSRPPFDPRYWIVKGSGVQRMPNGVPMQMQSAHAPTVSTH